MREAWITLTDFTKVLMDTIGEAMDLTFKSNWKRDKGAELNQTR